MPAAVQFLVKCIEGEIDTINLCKDKSTKVHTNLLYELFIDYFGFRNKISKIDFSRQLNKFGLKSKLVQISGSRLKGYVLNYSEIVSKLKELKIEIQMEDNAEENNIPENDVQENDVQENDVRKNNMNKFRISVLDF